MSFLAALHCNKTAVTRRDSAVSGERGQEIRGSTVLDGPAINYCALTSGSHMLAAKVTRLLRAIVAGPRPLYLAPNISRMPINTCNRGRSKNMSTWEKLYSLALRIKLRGFREGLLARNKICPACNGAMARADVTDNYNYFSFKHCITGI